MLKTDAAISLIDSEGHVNLGAVRDRFVLDVMEGHLSSDIKKLFEIDDSSIRSPIVPSALMDLGEDDPIAASERTSSFDPFQMPALGTPFPEAMTQPVWSEATYQRFCNDYGEKEKDWENNLFRILEKVTEGQRIYEKEPEIPYIKQVKHIFQGYGQTKTLFSGIKHTLRMWRKAYNTLLQDKTYSSDLEGISEEFAEKIRERYRAIQKLTESELLSNVIAIMHTFNDLDLHYAYQIQPLDPTSYAKRVYIQYAYYARGYLVSRGVKAQENDLKQLISDNNDFKAVKKKVEESCIQGEEKIHLIDYFLNVSILGKVLEDTCFYFWGEGSQDKEVHQFMKYLSERPSPIFKVINTETQDFRRKSLIYYTISNRDQANDTIYHKKIPAEQVKDFFQLRYKYDLPFWFSKGILIYYGENKEMKLKIQIDMNEADTKEMKEAYEYLIEYHKNKFKEYLVRLGWGRSHVSIRA